MSDENQADVTPPDDRGREITADWTGQCFACGEPREDHALITIDGKEAGICPVEERSVDAETSQQLLPGLAADGDSA